MFKWKDSFSVNVEALDQQHQELFKLAGSIYEIISIGDNVDRYDEIMKIIHELKEYITYHFYYEENLLEENNYPDFEKHKKEHQIFIEKVNSIDAKDVDEMQNKISTELITFLTDWIENHILKSDMAYGEFLNSKGVK